MNSSKGRGDPVALICANGLVFYYNGLMLLYTGLTILILRMSNTHSPSYDNMLEPEKTLVINAAPSRPRSLHNTIDCSS